MAFPNLEQYELVTNINPASIAEVFVKLPSQKYQNLGAIKDGEISFETVQVENSKLQTLMTDRMKVSGKFTMLETIDYDIINSFYQVLSFEYLLLKLIRSDAVQGTSTVSEQWILLPASSVGLAYTMRFGGDANSVNTIDVEFGGSIQLDSTTFNAIFKPSLATSMFETSSDTGTFHNLAIYTSSVPTGIADLTKIQNALIKNVRIKFLSDSSMHTLSYIINPKCELKAVTTTDRYLRNIPLNYYHVKGSFEHYCSKSDAVKLIPSMKNENVIIQFTLNDNNQLDVEPMGLQVAYSVPSNNNELQVLRFTFSGIMNITDTIIL